MVQLNWFQRFYWERLAKPKADRALYRLLIASPIESIIEVGVGDGQRMRRIAELLQVKNRSQPLRYVGVDGFESAQDGRIHLTLKQAHQLATQLGFRATLIPGDAASSMLRVAHKIGSVDLVIINGGVDLDQPTEGPIGKWLHHITHDKSAILACNQPGEVLKRISLAKSPLQRAA